MSMFVPAMLLRRGVRAHNAQRAAAMSTASLPLHASMLTVATRSYAPVARTAWTAAATRAPSVAAFSRHLSTTARVSTPHRRQGRGENRVPIRRKFYLRKRDKSRGKIRDVKHADGAARETATGDDASTHVNMDYLQGAVQAFGLTAEDIELLNISESKRADLRAWEEQSAAANDSAGAGYTIDVDNLTDGNDEWQIGIGTDDGGAEVADVKAQLLGLLNESSATSEDGLRSGDVPYSVQAVHDILVSERGIDVEVLDVADKCSWTQTIVVCSGRSARHILSMARALTKQLKQSLYARDGTVPHVEGEADSDWVVVDFGDCVVHLFTAAERERYNLESLWADDGDEPDGEGVSLFGGEAGGDLAGGETSWLAADFREAVASARAELESNIEMADDGEAVNTDDAASSRRKEEPFVYAATTSAAAPAAPVEANDGDGGVDYAALKVTELKVLLGERGLRKAGLKAELVARLVESDGGADS